MTFLFLKITKELLVHKPQKTRGNIFEILLALFVDDTALLADTHAELEMAAEELYHLFRRFGLLMHVGKKQDDGTWTESKTEALFCPAKHTNEIELPEPLFFQDGIHRIEYTRDFKYLGGMLTERASDEIEIMKRIRQAKNQMGALLNFFHSKADLQTKRFIFQAIPLNTVLYGCESWTITAQLEQKLTSFFHSSLRRILDLKMDQVKDHRIRNEHIQNKFNISDIMDTLRYRQFQFLGKIARLPDTCPQRKFLSAWINKARPVGRPKHTLRHQHVDTLRTILGNDIVSRDAKLKEWVPLTADAERWKETATLWRTECKERTRSEYGDHALLGGALGTQTE